MSANLTSHILFTVCKLYISYSIQCSLLLTIEVLCGPVDEKVWHLIKACQRCMGSTPTTGKAFLSCSQLTTVKSHEA